MNIEKSVASARSARVLSWSVAAATLISTGQTVNAENVYGATNGNKLVSWDRNTPGVISNSVHITGLRTDEKIQGMDFRPADGLLYALGSTSRVYVIDTATGAATEVGSGGVSPQLGGLRFGFDFNPQVDQIRQSSNSDQNHLLNPETGVVAITDANLAYAAGDANFGTNASIDHLAYTNGNSTNLFGIDRAADVLVTIDTDNGQLHTVGALGLNLRGLGGFDIASSDGIALAALRGQGLVKSKFYSINLQTGDATLIGRIGNGNINIRAMAVAIPGPGALMVFACGAFMGRSRRRA